MILLLSMAAIAADLSQTVVDPARRRAVQQCQASLARKAGGEVSDVTVTKFRRAGRRIWIGGVMNMLQRPASKPGELTPMHIINMRYTYECRLNGRAVPRVTISPLQ